MMFGLADSFRTEIEFGSAGGIKPVGAFG